MSETFSYNPNEGKETEKLETIYLKGARVKEDEKRPGFFKAVLGNEEYAIINFVDDIRNPKRSLSNQEVWDYAYVNKPVDVELVQMMSHEVAEGVGQFQAQIHSEPLLKRQQEDTSETV